MSIKRGATRINKMVDWKLDTVTRVRPKKNGAKCADLQARVEQLEKIVAELIRHKRPSDVADLVERLERSVEDHDSRIDTLENEVDEDVSMEQLDEKMEEIKEEIKSVKGDVSDLEEDVSDLKGDVRSMQTRCY